MGDMNTGLAKYTPEDEAAATFFNGQDEFRSVFPPFGRAFKREQSFLGTNFARTATFDRAVFTGFVGSKRRSFDVYRFADLNITPCKIREISNHYPIWIKFERVRFQGHFE